MITEKETYSREGREQPALDGRKSVPESVLAIRRGVSGIADSLRQRAGARHILGRGGCIDRGDPDPAPDHAGTAGDAGLPFPLFMLYPSTSHAR